MPARHRGLSWRPQPAALSSKSRNNPARRLAGLAFRKLTWVPSRGHGILAKVSRAGASWRIQGSPLPSLDLPPCARA